MLKGLGQLQFLKRNYCILKRERECACDIIEKELKALEIIKNKNVLLSLIKYNNLDGYNACCVKYEETLTQEEYNLLKEVLYEKED